VVNTWQVILATMLIFGTGVVTGGLLVQHSVRSRERHGQPHSTMGPHPLTPNSPAALSRIELLRRAQRELDLTPEQREPIERILKEGQERMKKITETVEPRRRQELRRTMDEFRQVLTPEQRTRFDQLLKQQQRPHDQHKSAPPREQPAPGLSPTNSAATNS
jgi:Spy/CpxP family protein refolding chaperone